MAMPQGFAKVHANNGEKRLGTATMRSTLLTKRTGVPLSNRDAATVGGGSSGDEGYEEHRQQSNEHSEKQHRRLNHFHAISSITR